MRGMVLKPNTWTWGRNYEDPYPNDYDEDDMNYRVYADSEGDWHRTLNV